MGFLKRFRIPVLLLILPFTLFYFGYRSTGWETLRTAAVRNHDSLLANMGRVLVADKEVLGEVVHRQDDLVVVCFSSAGAKYHQLGWKSRGILPRIGYEREISHS